MSKNGLCRDMSKKDSNLTSHKLLPRDHDVELNKKIMFLDQQKNDK